MKKKPIMVSGIAVIIAIIVIGITTQDLTTITVPEIQEKQFIKINPTDIVDFSAVQFGNELSLTMTIGDDVPITIDEIPLSDSAIGFGYGWYGDSEPPKSGHLEGGGSGHLQGYVVSMYHDTAEDGWQLEPVNMDLLTPFGWDIDYCLSLVNKSAKLRIQNNTIFVDTPPDIKPQVNAFFVNQAASLELSTSNKCHDNQIAATIIDIKMLE